MPTNQTLPERIMAVYYALASRPGGSVALVDLRARLGDVAASDLNRTLLAMDRRRELQLEPDPDRCSLTAEARKGAIKVGGVDCHLMWAEGR
jgi:hypothetical protein